MLVNVKKPTAAAGSEAQLSRVTEEMGMKSESSSHTMQVKNTSVFVRLMRLSEHTIRKHTKKAIPSTKPDLNQCDSSSYTTKTDTKLSPPSELVVKLHKLPLTPGQRVTLHTPAPQTKPA